MKIARHTPTPSFLRRQESIPGRCRGAGEDRSGHRHFHLLIWPSQGHSHSERSEESKIHNRKTGQPVSCFYRDQERKQRKNSLCQIYVRTDTLDSSTPLRSAQNDNDGVAFSRAMGRYIPLSARLRREPAPYSDTGAGVRVKDPVVPHPRSRRACRSMTLPNTHPHLTNKNI